MSSPAQNLMALRSLWWREMARFFRQRNRVIGAFGTPVIFWLLIGSGVGSSFHLPGLPEQMDYNEYFYPGTLLLIILFTSIFSSISIIEDRREGFLQAVLTAPVYRVTLVLGKVLGGASIAFIQAVLFLIPAPFIGIPIDWMALPMILVLLALLSLSLSALGYFFAWKFDSSQAFHAIMNLILFPMWLLSGALFDPSGSATWMKYVIMVNPLSYGLAGLRHMLYSPAEIWVDVLPPFNLCLAILVTFTIITMAAATWITCKRPS